MFGRRLVLALVAMLGATGCQPGGPRSANSPAELSGIAGWKGAMPNSDDAFRFVVTADRTGGHVEGEWQAAVEQVNLLGADFVMSVGDYIEGYSEDVQEVNTEWEEFDAQTHKLNAPFFYCPGNHDVTNDVMAGIYRQRRGVDGRTYYSFDYRGCHFVVLDMAPVPRRYADFEEQFAWLGKDLAAAKDARHVFVFYHQPHRADRIWTQLRQLLPAGKTTIFNGHTHELSYEEVDGIPTYVLAATGADVGPGDRGAGQYRMFAHVSVSGGKPTVALVPLHEVAPGQIGGFATAVRLMKSKTTGTNYISAKGGTYTLKQENSLDVPVMSACRWDSADWSASPAAAEFEIPPGGTAARDFVLSPTSGAFSEPALNVTYRATPSGAGRPVESFQTIEAGVYRVMDVAGVQGIVVDGDLADWQAVQPVNVAEPFTVTSGQETWTGPNDASYKLRVGTDERSLFLAVDVTDDQIVIDANQPDNSDGLQVRWDARPEAESDGGHGDRTGYLAMPLPQEGAQPWLQWHMGVRPQPAGAKASFRRRDGGYVCELSVPLEELQASVPPKAGQSMRLEVVLVDRDMADGKAVVSRITSGGSKPDGSTKGYILSVFR